MSRSVDSGPQEYTASPPGPRAFTNAFRQKRDIEIYIPSGPLTLFSTLGAVLLGISVVYLVLVLFITGGGKQVVVALLGIVIGLALAGISLVLDSRSR